MPRRRTPRLLLYGATGYTGRLIAQRAARVGLDVLLSGRDKSRLDRVATEFGFDAKAVDLGDNDRLRKLVASATLMLNAAGPFGTTIGPVLDACLSVGTHYIDVAGDLNSFVFAGRHDGAARAAGAMLMPGVGFGIVASDCLGAHAVGRLKQPRWLRVGLDLPTVYSRGSMRTMMSMVGDGVFVRRNGRLLSLPVARMERAFEFGEGDVGRSTGITWPDVYTSYFTSGVPNIEVYARASPPEWLAYVVGGKFAQLVGSGVAKKVVGIGAEFWPEAPAGTRDGVRCTIVAEVENVWRERAVSRLTTGDSYHFTAAAAVEVSRRVLGGKFAPGFQTPAGLFGPDLILSLPQTTREDV